MSKPIGHVVLEDAIKLIEDPRCWIKGDYEREVKLKDPGKGFFAFSRPATGYCIDGAIRAAAKQRFSDAGTVQKATDQAQKLVLNGMGWKDLGEIHNWNDEDRRTHGQVIEAMKRSLAAA